MHAVVRHLESLLAQAQQPRAWVRPPPGTLQRGVFWVRYPRATVAAAVGLLVALLALAVYRRVRR